MLESLGQWEVGREMSMDHQNRHDKNLWEKMVRVKSLSRSYCNQKQFTEKTLSSSRLLCNSISEVDHARSHTTHTVIGSPWSQPTTGSIGKWDFFGMKQNWALFVFLGPESFGYPFSNYSWNRFLELFSLVLFLELGENQEQLTCSCNVSFYTSVKQKYTGQRNKERR